VKNKIKQISLMVFDECHHTRKNHPYNGIMREYFQIPAKRRPKIFGMTASPVWNPKDAVTSLATLEHSLDAKLIAVRLHDEELALHVPKPIEVRNFFDSVRPR
jgi:endoribonuclease Dicer